MLQNNVARRYGSRGESGFWASESTDGGERGTSVCSTIIVWCCIASGWSCILCLYGKRIYTPFVLSANIPMDSFCASYGLFEIIGPGN